MKDKNGNPCAPALGALPARHCWEIDRLTDHGGGHYRYGIAGTNHHTGERFSWSVPSIWGDQYAFADAVSIPERPTEQRASMPCIPPDNR